MRISILTIAVLATASAATAQTILSVPLKIGAADSVLSQSYTCGDAEAFAVQYVNSGANALAIMQIDGEERIFVNVVSASGAKYVSGADVWWTKGDSATRENEMKAGGPQTCTAQSE